eukprot:scaffold675931_cov47-Prasinocladus_malaysianus.AAC.1
MICPDPTKRITLSELQREPWVTEGGYQPRLGTVTKVGESEAHDIFEANSVQPVDMTQSQQNLIAMGQSLGQAAMQSGRVNAFLLISAAIDLSGMFEQRKVRHTKALTSTSIFF